MNLDGNISPVCVNIIPLVSTSPQMYSFSVNNHYLVAYSLNVICTCLLYKCYVRSLQVSDLFADSPFPIFTSNYCECHSLVNLAFLLNGQTNGCLVLHHRSNVLEIKAHLVE